MPKLVDHEERRGTIADAVLRVVGSKGVNGVTVRDVAEEAGCSTGMVNHYFASKHALMVAASKIAIDRMMPDWNVLTDAAHAGPELLRQTLLACMPMSDAEIPLHRVFVYLYGEGMSTPEIADVIRGYYELGVERIGSVLEQGLEEGWVRADVDIDAASRVLLAVVDALGLQRVFGLSRSDPDRLRSYLDWTIRQLTVEHTATSAP